MKPELSTPACNGVQRRGWLGHYPRPSGDHFVPAAAGDHFRPPAELMFSRR